jgi:hypothetical protein
VGAQEMVGLQSLRRLRAEADGMSASFLQLLKWCKHPGLDRLVVADDDFVTRARIVLYALASSLINGASATT